MRNYYNAGQLAVSFSKLREWADPSDLPATKVTDRYQSCCLYINGRYTDDGEHFKWVLDDFAPLHVVQATRLLSGGVILPHTDPGPYKERWQIPVVVSGYFIEGDDPKEQIPGVPWRVNHHIPHHLYVPITAPPREILLLDRNIMLGVPNADYTVEHECARCRCTLTAHTPKYRIDLDTPLVHCDHCHQTQDYI